MQKAVYKSITLSFVFVLLLIPAYVFAATLSLSPNTISTTVGSSFSVNILTNTSGKYINNSDAVIQFPTDLLQVVSINKNASIFSLWVEEPTFSNSSGIISYNGGVVNPGYKGASGTIATIVFKAKKEGVASILYTSASVRENDGLGTNILTTKTGSVVTVGISENTVTSEDIGSATLTKPLISSDTHPDQESWYITDTASFNWKVPSGVNSIKTLFNKISNSTPTVVYDSSVSEKTLTNISDGIHYFHLQYSSATNISATAHYKIQVDATPPKDFVPTVRVQDYENIITLDAEDATSGIDYYTIEIDSGELVTIQDDMLVDEEYSLPALNHGDHNLIVTAYDRAGNHTKAEIMFNSSFISTPVLSINETEIVRGESIIIFGESDYPGKQVSVTIESDGKSIKQYTQAVSSDGTFTITTDGIKKVGFLSIYGVNVLSETVKSHPSEKIFLVVNQTNITQVLFTMLWAILVLIVVVALFIVAYVGWHKYFGLKRKLESELKETTTKIHNELVLVKDDLVNQLLSLEAIKIDRVLNKKEKIIFNRIQKNIDDIDAYIEKRLKKLM